MTTQPPPLPPVRQRSDTDFLVEYLQTHELLCPVCKYNLRALTRPRCPECGRELVLTVGTTEPYLRAWAVLTAVSAAVAGLGLTAAILVCRWGWPARYEPVSLRWLSLNGGVALSMANIPLPILAIAFRRLFLRLAPWAQWLLVVLYTLLSAAIFAAFIYYLP